MISLACTQVADLQESARAFIHSMNSPLAVHTPTPRVVAMKPLESWTSEAVAFDCDRISKIRARQSVENRLLYTGHAVGRRESERCEQEVGRQKGGHTSRAGPVAVRPYLEPPLPRLPLRFSRLRSDEIH